MTRDELHALALTLPADLLFSRLAAQRFLPGVTDPEAAVSYCIKAGWWQCRDQFGVSEVWIDSRKEWAAKINSSPHKERCIASAVAVAAELPQPVKPKLKPAPPIGGLFN